MPYTTSEWDNVAALGTLKGPGTEWDDHEQSSRSMGSPLKFSVALQGH